MKKSNQTVSGIGSVFVEGLSEAQKLAEIKRVVAAADQREAKKAERDQRVFKERVEALRVKRDTKNPQIQPETLRPTGRNELIGGKPAKGWAVTIGCESCCAPREVNTQDAHQVRFCSDACKPRKSTGTTKAAKELLKTFTLEELRQKLAEAEAQAKAS